MGIAAIAQSIQDTAFANFAEGMSTYLEAVVDAESKMHYGNIAAAADAGSSPAAQPARIRVRSSALTRGSMIVFVIAPPSPNAPRFLEG